MLVWDSANVAHIARHDISPSEVEQVVANNPLDLGRQIKNGEARRMHLGETNGGQILVIILTDQNNPRPVTAHPAKARLRKFYTTQKANRHVENS